MVAWLAHLYTACGAVAAFLAAAAVVDADYRRAFLWLYVQVAIDATDGTIARALLVNERLPSFDGAKLDDLVDYLSYVFVPALIVWRAGLVPETWSMPVVAAMLLSSAYGFNRNDAKTEDHFFLGFPSYWNIAALYLFIARWPPHVNASILGALAVLVFVPLRYVYPSRGTAFQKLTLALSAVWSVLLLAIVWQLPVASRAVVIASLAFPVYYLGLSIWLHVQRRRA
jgi:phosphatidylcholine synthase